MAKKLVSYIKELAGSDGWVAMSDDLKKAIGSVPPPLEQKAIELINSEIEAKNCKVDLWKTLDSLDSTETLNQVQTMSAPESKPTAETKPNETAKPAGIKGFFQGKWFKWISTAVLIITIVAVAIFWFLGGSNPESANPEKIQSQQQNQQPNQQPNLLQTQTESVPAFRPETTVDYKSISVVGTTLIMLVLGAFLISALGILDGKERFQVSDVVVALTGYFLNYFVIWAPMLAFLTAFKPIGNPGTAMFYVVSLIIVVVIFKAINGGIDFTNLGVFLACLALTGAITGTMGAIQQALSVPSQPVYLLQDLPGAIATKQGALIQYSMLVYTMFFLAMACYLLDIFYPRDGEIRWEAIVMTFLVVIGFYVSIFFMPRTAALVVATAFTSLVATFIRRAGKGVTTGENVLSKVVARVFEYTAWDGVALGILIVILLRLSGFA